jgi:hypothetical protein
MSITANSLDKSNKTEVYVPYEMLSVVQRAYVDWKAIGGIVADDTGIHRITLDELGKMCGVTSEAFRKSKNTIPNFWELVTDRRKVINSQSRLAAMHDKWFVAAAGMKNWALTEAWLINNDPNYKQPRMKVEHEMGNSWAALADAVDSSDAIEGEVVDEPKTV